MTDNKYPTIIFYFLCVLCLLPFVSAPLALLGGIIFATAVGNPLIEKTQKFTQKFLQFSVVGLGFGMNAAVALQAGRQGLLYTVCGIVLTFTFGFLISRFLKVDRTTAYLISAGTAICGGSAIAAVAPVIKAKNENTSVALGVVFTLNSVALLLFPFIGHRLGLTQPQFGIWSAIAIHDTSSVVGASAQYGTLALATATTVKLTRALWIVPVSFVSGIAFKSGTGRAKFPLFIIFFFCAIILNTYIVPLHGLFQFAYAVSKQTLVLTLFLIGSNLSLKTVKTVGARPFVMGILLWILISSLSLFAVEKLI